MKKLAVFLFAVAMVAMSAGTARAERGIWYHSISFSWATYFNLLNTSNGTITATVDFYTNNVFANASPVGSTTRVMGPYDLWNFSTAGIGTLTASSMDSYQRGQWRGYSSGAAGVLRGYGTQFQPTYNSGFNFRVDMNGQATE